ATGPPPAEGPRAARPRDRASARPAIWPGPRSARPVPPAPRAPLGPPGARAPRRPPRLRGAAGSGDRARAEPPVGRTRQQPGLRESGAQEAGPGSSWTPLSPGPPRRDSPERPGAVRPVYIRGHSPLTLLGRLALREIFLS